MCKFSGFELAGCRIIVACYHACYLRHDIRCQNLAEAAIAGIIKIARSAAGLFFPFFPLRAQENDNASVLSDKWRRVRLLAVFKFFFEPREIRSDGAHFAPHLHRISDVAAAVRTARSFLHRPM
jgi:hypothetical protein